MTSPDNIKPYIDLGWYTVPLSGKITRLADGSKTVPNYPKNWKALHTETKNESPAPVGALLTGKISNVIAIDCDNQATLDLFMAQCPETPMFLSVGKPEGGGTLLFSYKETGVSTFRLHDGNIDIDYFTDSGACYLPTKNNPTKAASKYSLLSLPKMPASVLALVKALYKVYTLKDRQLKSEAAASSYVHTNHLQPQVELFIATGKFTKSLFKIITPKSFRKEDQYVKEGFLHPSNINKGDGSDYLMKVSAILGADSSIDSRLYFAFIRELNSLWSDPMPLDRLEATITAPMIELRASINGVPIWKYDENWASNGLTMTNKLGEAIEIFFDDVRASYYVINYTLTSIQKYDSTGSKLASYLAALVVGAPIKVEITAKVPLVRAVSDPTAAFGYYYKDKYTKMFNLFSQTTYLEILQNPEPYRSMYVRPNTVLNYFNSLIPEKEVRDYVLKFIRHKLRTFEYSPVVLYFLGASGSGKDTFVEILSRIVGENNVAKPTPKEFLDKYNGYMLDTFFVHLDEYGNQLSRPQDKDEALGKIKAYTGKKRIMIREMREDGFPHDHRVTFISTANKNPLIVEDQDRRLAVIDTPIVLADEEWVRDSGGMSKVYEDIFSELQDFCYYLATEVEGMTRDEYTKPIETVTKDELMYRCMPAGKRMAYLLAKCKFTQFEELVEEHGVSGIFDKVDAGRIELEPLFELYESVTGGAGTLMGLSRYMKDAGFEKKGSTRLKRKVYYFDIPLLSQYTPGGLFDPVG